MVKNLTYPLTANRPCNLFIVQMPFEFGGHAGVELLLPLWLPLQANIESTAVID